MRHFSYRLRCILLAACLSAGPALASPVEAVSAQARDMLQERVQPQAEALGARVEVRLDPSIEERVARAPCTPDVFFPPGTRISNKTYIGLRCPGTSWQVRVAAEVAMYAPVPIPVRPVAAGAAVQPGDWALTEINVAGWSRPMVTDAALLDGATAGRLLRAGEPIPPDSLRVRGRMGVGDPVQVILMGQGFTVKMAGKILQTVEPGQSARVKLESGRTVAGVLRDDRAVEVQLSM